MSIFEGQNILNKKIIDRLDFTNFQKNEIIYEGKDRNGKILSSETFILTKVIGAENNGLVFDITIRNGIFYSNNYCLKLCTNTISTPILHYINNSPYFVHVKLCQKINIPISYGKKSFENFTFIIMEKVDHDLLYYCNRNEKGKEKKHFTAETLNYITAALLNVTIDMYEHNMYYFDLKPSNIGITFYDGEMQLKLFDIESLHIYGPENNYTYIHSQNPQTSSDIFNDHTDDIVLILQYQLMTVVFTLMACIFNSQSNLCNPTFSNQTDFNKLPYLNTNKYCHAYKGSLIAFVNYVTTYVYDKRELYSYKFSIENDFIKYIYEVLKSSTNQEYFNKIVAFLSHLLYILLLATKTIVIENEVLIEIIRRLFPRQAQPPTAKNFVDPIAGSQIGNAILGKIIVFNNDHIISNVFKEIVTKSKKRTGH